MFFQMNMMRYALRVVRGEPAGFENLFEMNFAQYWSFFGTYLIVGIAVCVGFLLCIAPGVFLLLAWMLAVPLVVDRKLGPIEAMTQSWALTEGKRTDLLVYWLLTLGVAVLGILACCVGVFVSLAIINLANMIVYLRLTNQPLAPRT